MKLMQYTHIDENNHPNMVDVTSKDDTHRVAKASGVIKMSKNAYEDIINQKAKKGPVLQTAIIAAIMGAKKTSELIPMCHPLLLTSVQCETEELPSHPGFKLHVTVKLNGQTGVEMEALNGVSIGLLTIYDMMKAVDKTMVISDIRLDYKSGGKSGEYRRH
jgi:cyclic pyranopterin phosphate synthase